MAPQFQFMSVIANDTSAPEIGGRSNRDAFISLGTVMGVCLIFIILVYVARLLHVFASRAAA